MNIFLSGYLDRNFGDDIMLRIAAEQLKEHNLYMMFPREELYIPFKDVDNIIPYHPGDKVKLDMGLTVVGSGFIVKGWTSIIYFIKEERERRKASKGMKTAVIGCNIGPYKGFIGKQLVKWKCRSFDLITVRDEPSLEFVKKYAKKTKSEIHHDIVFSIPDEWIPYTENEDCLGISAYRRADKSNADYYKVLARTADKYISETGKKVLLFAFDVELENDLCAAHTIKSMMRYGENAEIVAHIDNGENIISGLGRCSRLITSRLHMSVMAIRMGIPFVPIAYADKTRNVLKNLGYEGEVFDINALNSERLYTSAMNAKPYKVDKKFLMEARGHTNCVTEMLR